MNKWDGFHREMELAEKAIERIKGAINDFYRFCSRLCKELEGNI